MALWGGLDGRRPRLRHTGRGGGGVGGMPVGSSVLAVVMRREPHAGPPRYWVAGRLGNGWLTASGCVGRLAAVRGHGMPRRAWRRTAAHSPGWCASSVSGAARLWRHQEAPAAPQGSSCRRCWGSCAPLRCTASRTITRAGACAWQRLVGRCAYSPLSTPTLELSLSRAERPSCRHRAHPSVRAAAMMVRPKPLEWSRKKETGGTSGRTRWSVRHKKKRALLSPGTKRDATRTRRRRSHYHHMHTHTHTRSEEGRKAGRLAHHPVSQRLGRQGGLLLDRRRQQSNDDANDDQARDGASIATKVLWMGSNAT